MKLGWVNKVMRTRLFGIETRWYLVIGNLMFTNTRCEGEFFFTQRLLQFPIQYIFLPISSSGRPYIYSQALQ